MDISEKSIIRICGQQKRHEAQVISCGKGKGKFYHRADHEGPEGRIALSFATVTF
jgi:hypothetical protein